MPTIACNLNSYGSYRDSAFEHLSKIGLTNVEIFCPAPEETQSVRTSLNQHGLTATSMIIKCSIGEINAVEQFTQSLDIVESFDVPIVFTSIKAGETNRALVYERLRQIGDAAASRNITIAMETHPDLITNGDIARQTMEAINHPNVRVNFDTANLYYYNRDITATGELEKVIDYVAAVHLKDTNGEFETWHFPALGEGIVDFPAIFDRLNKHNYTGPFTFELEGIKGENLSQEGTQVRIEESLTYLRETGLI
ncbi:MAG: sugar phosphate isomerase/epimerase family protein [Candidatus Latescibacteria bacterium]|jgi:sugar phosphate isomerase/epimerase|nr:sugar phosphate isomerase/epimerase family protein [Candidatus Latescibacterota bacterium]